MNDNGGKARTRRLEIASSSSRRNELNSDTRKTNRNHNAGSDSKRRRLDGQNEIQEEPGGEDLKNAEGSSTSANGYSSVEFDTTSQMEGREEVVSIFVSLDRLPERTPRVPQISDPELQELERVLEFKVDDPSEAWRDDWSGNLSYCDKEIANPQAKGRERKSFKQSLLLWAKNSIDSFRLLRNLLRHIYHLPGTPPTAKKIIASSDLTSLEVMRKCIRRLSYDPSVLREDGWTTAKSAEPQGATGGPFLIGESISWQGSDAIVIAYVHDSDIGDLWKALWIDGEEYDSFDLEAEELLEAKRKWERRQNQTNKSAQAQPTRPRMPVNVDFTVEGIEYGVVLAASYSKGSRPGVYWPARVQHPSELDPSIQGKRNASKQKVDLIFLAPYWNSTEQHLKSRRVEALSEAGSSTFYTSPLFQIETVDATDEMIKPFSHIHDDFLDIEQLRNAFRFTGLPKSAFERFLDSYRLAMALRKYARTELSSKHATTSKAAAGLFETHPLSVQSPNFPPVILNLPYSFILSRLPKSGETVATTGGESSHGLEPVVDLSAVVASMKPPNIWGKTDAMNSAAVPPATEVLSPQRSVSTWLASITDTNGIDSQLTSDMFISDLPLLREALSVVEPPTNVHFLANMVTSILTLIAQKDVEGEGKTNRRRKIFSSWMALKALGEIALCSSAADRRGLLLADWRRAAERIYKYAVIQLSGAGVGNDSTVIMTDPRCNGHRTSYGCFERQVRLPAAIKGAKLAGAGTGNIRLVTAVEDRLIDFVERNILIKAHSSGYLKRMKARCAAARSEEEVLLLTDDSDGNGGEDTRGSRGTWVASVAAVAVAVSAVSQVVYGECMNAFCITRPPGHHAGRMLHPMKAVSNGFCVLNSVACAAIYAVTSLADGGAGLSRVCVIDFDVHHGNGTQDILCSTYDPRFLYCSIHAGGAHVNGAEVTDDDPDHELHDLAHHKSPHSGIFPGRCGDSSPHKGVLNIPLGSKVTAHDIGAALLGSVTSAVDAFSPDLIILSAGFDAHKSDPMGLGTLSAADFGHITEVACQLAFKTCSGRLVSVLEGGYGVPCCSPQTVVPQELMNASSADGGTKAEGDQAVLSGESQLTGSSELRVRPQPSKVLDLGEDKPDEMDDQVPYALQRRLEKCHAEGFIECVREHVSSLARCNSLV